MPHPKKKQKPRPTAQKKVSRLKGLETDSQIRAHVKRSLDDRMRVSLKSLGDQYGVMSNEDRASLLGTDRKNFDRWFHSRGPLPRVELLYKVGFATGDSIDWLLGLGDVPRSRIEREKTGDLSLELANLLRQRGPAYIKEREIRSLEGPRFAESIVDDWWKGRLRSRASEATTMFRELALAVHEEARELRDTAAEAEAKKVAAQCHMAASRLELPELTWEDLSLAYHRLPCRQVLGAPGALRLETPFEVIGYYGFIWRTARRDIAVYLDRVNERDLYCGHVVRRRDTRRFLREEQTP